MTLVVDDRFREVIGKKIKAKISINENGCWVWQRAKHKYGYGKTIHFQKGKKIFLSAHRASWLVFKGEIPEKMSVCHNCPAGDNPACCNPDHLFLGTPKDNTHDMMKKGKLPDFRGENNNGAILTELKVKEMRNLYKCGMSGADIARKFNVKYFTCLDAINGRNWRHI